MAAPPKRRPVTLPELDEAADTRLRAAGELDRLALRDLDLSGQNGTACHVTECLLAGCVLDEVDLTRAKLHDVVIDAARSSSLTLVGASLHDVELTGTRIGALLATDTAIKHVVAHGGRWSFANLRGARLTDVVFEDLAIDELDLGAATLTRVAFLGCTIGRLSLHAATLADVDVSSSRIGEIDGIEHARGMTMSMSQLISLAPAMADHLGIELAGPPA